jgi:CHAT domain-containing protein
MRDELRAVPGRWSVLAAAALLVALLAGPATGQDAEALLLQAETLRQEGRVPEAVRLLQQARDGMPADADVATRAAVLGALGSALLDLGRLDAARDAIDAGLALAQGAGLAAVAARTLLNRGNLELAESRARLRLEEPERARRGLEAALADYAEAARLAELAGEPALVARAHLNAARVRLQREAAQVEAARADLDAAEAALARLPAMAQPSLDRLTLGRLRLELPVSLPDQAMAAWRTLDAVRQDAAIAGDSRSEAWALLYLGQVYQRRGRDDEATALWRKGALRAQAAPAPDILWRLQAAIGEALAREGDREAAIRAYKGAVTTLQGIRLDLPTFDPVTGESLFRKEVGPVFLALSDLLLKEAASRGAQGQVLLVEARRQIETLKAVELEDYFQDDCVADLQARIRPVDRPIPATATIYPVMLDDRTELLVSLPDGRIHQQRVDVGRERLEAEARAFRALLERRPRHDYIGPARQLYDWLIRPLEPAFAAEGVEVLVLVPDGALRNIPFAAMEDGERFLIERFAVATAPGLNLVDLEPRRRVEPNLLLSGLTEAVALAGVEQEYPPLPFVEGEISAIREMYGGGEVLLNEVFRRETVRSSLEQVPFTYVHIASHGEFKGDPKDSFLLAYDGKIDMDRLEQIVKQSRFREQPVELLTLSACRTAAGDDRSALGLAGVAVKAGARSALASLWFINDESSSLLVERFYWELAQEPGLSKAEALRRAQVWLLGHPERPAYAHPAYWAPFLLIGNWL